MRIALVTILCAGCGRVGFDRASDAKSVDTSGDPDIATVCTGGTTEACDGVDNDCNGQVDEVCPCTPFDVNLPIAIGYPPALVWTGTGFLTVGRNALPQYYVAPISATGVAGAAVPFAPADTTHQPSPGRDTIAWNGSSALITYVDPPAQIAYGVLFDPKQGTVGPPIRLSATAVLRDVHLAWAGDRFIVGWVDPANVAVLRELDASGQPSGPEHAVATDLPTLESIIATKTAYVLTGATSGMIHQTVFVDRSTFFAMTHPLVVTGANLVTITQGPGGFIAGNSNSSGFQFQLLDATATPTTARLTVPSDGTDRIVYGSVASDGTVYRLFGYTSASTTKVVKQVALDASGAVVPPRLMLSSFTSGLLSDPSAVAATGRIAVLIVSVAANTVKLAQTCNN